MVHRAQDLGLNDGYCLHLFNGLGDSVGDLGGSVAELPRAGLELDEPLVELLCAVVQLCGTVDDLAGSATELPDAALELLDAGVEEPCLSCGFARRAASFGEGLGCGGVNLRTGGPFGFFGPGPGRCDAGVGRRSIGCAAGDGGHGCEREKYLGGARL